MLSGKHVIDDKDGVVSRLRDAIHYKPEVPDVEFEEMTKDAAAEETPETSTEKKGESKATDDKSGTQNVKVEETLKDSEKTSENENGSDKETLKESGKTSEKENANDTSKETLKGGEKTSENENSDDKSIKRKRN